MTLQIHKQKRKNEDRRAFFGLILEGLWIILRSFGKGVGWFLQQAWRGIKWIMRNAWRTTRGLLRYSWLAALWLLQKPWQLLRRLLYGRIPEFENTQQEEAFWRIKRRFGRRRFFLTHVFVFIMGMGFIWSDWLAMMRLAENSPYGFTVHTENYIIGSTVWILLLLFHFLRLRIGDAEEEALGSVMEMGTSQQASAKRKRDEAAWKRRQQRLSDERYDESAHYDDQDEEGYFRQMK